MTAEVSVGEIAVGEVVTGEIVLGKLRWGNDLTPFKVPQQDGTFFRTILDLKYIFFKP